MTWREGVAEANCSAVRDGRDTCESAVDRPISLSGWLRRLFLIETHRERHEVSLINDGLAGPCLVTEQARPP